MEPKVTIKGIREGLLITVSEGEWPQIQASLMEQINRRAEFIQGAQLTLDVGNHILHATQLGKLRDAISDAGLTLTTILSRSPTTETTAQTLGLGTRRRVMHPKSVARPLGTTIQGEEAILVRRTLRSGFKLEHAGHVTVIGDVNPGAEIVAGGSIVIWGRLRGVAHAGAGGDESASVCALVLSPTQLRIAGQIAIAPAAAKDPQPEIAVLRDGQVVAEPWNVRIK